jgi:hypothetical protein
MTTTESGVLDLVRVAQAGIAVWADHASSRIEGGEPIIYYSEYPQDIEFDWRLIDDGRFVVSKPGYMDAWQ